MKKRIIALICALGLIFILASCGGTEAEEEQSAVPSEEPVAEETAEPTPSEEPEMLGALTAEVSFETVGDTIEEDGVAFLQYTSLVPSVTINGEKYDITEAIESALTTAVTVPQETIDEYSAESKELYSYMSEDSREYWGGYSYNISATVERATGYLSLEIVADIYTGGAHGSQIVTGITFDLATGEEISGSDLAEDSAALNVKVVELVEAQAAEDFEEGMLTGDVGAFAEGVLSTSAWYLTEEALVVFASEYEIAPYAAGIIHFTLPYSELSGLIKPEFLPAE